MQNFGLIRQGAGKAVLKRIPIPNLRDDYILVRTVAIALNPTDWTTLDAPGDDGTLVGCDYSGIVEEVGSAVTKSFKKGDRIAGFAHGGNDSNPENGAFAKYIAVKGDLQMHIPDDVTFEEAATVGVGIGTTGYALYKILGLPFPNQGSIEGEDGEPILIYGGSTATGTIAIQFARMSGRKVLTTSSPKHFDLLRERGAHAVYDYRTPNVGAQIRAATSNSLTTILDTVNLASTAAICAEAFAPPETTSPAAKKTYVNLIGLDNPRADVTSIFFLGYSMSGEAYIFERGTYAAQPEDFVFGVEWYGIAEGLWAQGKWKVHPQRVGEGGLRGALVGMQEMREGKVSGEKLVYRVGETEWALGEV